MGLKVLCRNSLSVFTNQDIEKYKGPSEAKTTDTKTGSREDMEKSAE